MASDGNIWCLFYAVLNLNKELDCYLIKTLDFNVYSLLGMAMINMDFSKFVLIHTSQQDWQLSPMAGVSRKPLARAEAERGHATSLVQYEAGSLFRPHPHPLGEEILVLDGIFSDENGDYPAGSYFRNPPGSSHAPYSEEGCLLFVKLHQFQETDLNSCLNPPVHFWHGEDVASALLYRFGQESVWLARMSPEVNLLLSLDLSANIEVFVISGEAVYGNFELQAGSWMREPNFHSDEWQVKSSTLLWIKSGHF
ncbi:cupin domain-containing protein [Marinomonas dokdonensis]|uniref:cupin domain-containing protein n=1 Tax=Marinomonas dokdonensis TaxID=328224 RepID=UPI004055574D